MPKLKLGNLELNNGLMLAPMAGVTDYAFRSVCYEMGCEFSVSEMISAKALYYNDKKTAILANIRENEAPTAIQIFGSEPDIMADSAKRLSTLSYEGCVSKIKPVAIDINMGCPVPKITKNNEGSALMKSPLLVAKIVESVVRAVDIPVTVKIRTGWDEKTKNAVEIAKIIEESGARALCIHGRTKMQMYEDPVDIETIGEVKAALKIPVIGNGGIYCCEDAVRMYEKTGVDAVMVARGAQGNPFIFRELTAYFEGREYKAPSMEERIDTALIHLERLIEDKGEHTGILEARRHISWYIKSCPGACEIRNRINKTERYTELVNILMGLKESLK